MSIVITSAGDNQYVLEGQLDFTTATEALAGVSERIAEHTHTVLDLGGITAANSAGLALLVEWQSVARKAGKTLSFENLPDSLTKIAVVCQVDDLL